LRPAQFRGELGLGHAGAFALSRKYLLKLFLPSAERRLPHPPSL
jgi:hypothetical protein